MQKWVYPLYFANEALDNARFPIKAGRPFPFQDKFFIRGLGRAYGVKDADTRPFADLPYVTVLNVHGQEVAREIINSGLTLDQAKALVEPAKKGRK